MSDKSEIILYQSTENEPEIQVVLQDETVWLTQAEMVTLFQRDKRTISYHIRGIFKEGELDENSVVQYFRTTAADGKSYNVAYYNLDVIISVGYRVRSHRGTQFRIWATKRLREYLIKGFVMDDDRLNRDIRPSGRHRAGRRNSLDFRLRRRLRFAYWIERLSVSGRSLCRRHPARP